MTQKGHEQQSKNWEETPLSFSSIIYIQINQ
jgi:hypothetical protein